MAPHWTPEQKARACEEILAQVRKGKSLSAVCAPSRDDWIPPRQTFEDWCEADPQLSGEYARAREQRAEVIFEECLAIADSQEGDVIVADDGTEQVNHDAIARAKLRIDTRKWMLGKMQPKVYGDKLELDGKVGLTVVLESDADKL